MRVRRISQRLAALRGFSPAPVCVRRIFPADLRRLCANDAYGNDQSSVGSSALSRATLILWYSSVSTYGGIRDTAGESRSAVPCQSTVGASVGTHRRWRSRNSMRTVEEALTACCASLAHTHNGVIALEPAGAPSGGGSANQAAALSRGECVPPAGNASAVSSAGRFPNVHLEAVPTDNQWTRSDEEKMSGETCNYQTIGLSVFSISQYDYQFDGLSDFEG